jgi:DNA-binding transcriptional regulator YdaS (Cro superfamily)
VPVATATKITALSEDLGSQRRVAELLGVSPAQVTRWRQGGGIDLINAERVDLLEMVLSSLLRLYPADAAEHWLRGLNPRLGDRRPIDLVRAGRTQELLGAIADERAGGYA